MKCKCCKNDIPEKSLYCMFCGEKLVKTAKEKGVTKVPKPHKLKSGEWMGQLMVNGERFTVKGSTISEYTEKAIAFKKGYLSADVKPKATLHDAIRQYIDRNENVLSPASVRVYENILKYNYKAYMDKRIDSINYQSMINDESAHYAPKTIDCSWRLVCVSLKAANYPPPVVNLPKIPASDKPFLDYEEITAFLKTVRGRKVELAAILALHSLRVSEILDLEASQIHDGFISVNGAAVLDKNNLSIHRDVNKTAASSRSIPVIIDRLYDLLPESGKLVPYTRQFILMNVKKTCVDANVTVCGTHDLRRSFASLAYHLKWNSQTTQQIGGWSNLATIEKVYRKLSAKEKSSDVERMRAFFNDVYK